MKVVILEGAEHDLQGIKRYVLKNFGPEGLEDTSKKLRESIRLIKTFPLGGAIPDELVELGVENYRQVISGMNRLIYEVREDAAYIHIICDTRRNLRDLLSRRLLRVVR
jgi:toxin ParE1/3/4